MTSAPVSTATDERAPTIQRSVRRKKARTAVEESTSTRLASSGPDIEGGSAELHATTEQPSPASDELAGGEVATRATPVVIPPTPGGHPIDASILLLADLLDDYEQIRMANDARYHALTEDWGKGVSRALPEVQLLESQVEQIKALEHGAELALRRAFRKHPLAEWQKTMAGVGEKQLARLLATIGDPYWHPLHGRPRTVSELWAYCGYHVLPPGGRREPDTHLSRTPGGEPADGQRFHDTRDAVAAAGDSSRPDMTASPATGSASTPSAVVASSPDVTTAGGEHLDGAHLSNADTQEVPGAVQQRGAAPRRRKGQRANWNTAAKVRAYLIAESAVKKRCAACTAAGKSRAEGATGWQPPPQECICEATCPLRAVYDEFRARYKDRIGEDGEPWTDGHQHQAAMRAVSKRLLRELWRAARKIHEGGDA